MTLTVSHDEDLKSLTDAVAGPVRDRASRNMSGIARLFAERPELRGVLAAADLADDSIRWSA